MLNDKRIQTAKKFIEENKLDGERWKQVEFDSRYFISDFGRVLSMCFNYPNILIPFYRKGYETVRIGQKKYDIHRLVAYHFCERKEGKNIVHHKDGTIHNNHYTNLVWVSEEEHTELHKIQKQKNNKGVV